MRNSLFKLICS